jgi:hypothetical protein
MVCRARDLVGGLGLQIAYGMTSPTGAHAVKLFTPNDLVDKLT